MKIRVGIIVFFGLVIVAMSLPSFKNVEKKTPFKVVRVNGKIEFEKTGVEMKRGDSYLYGTPIKFYSEASKAAIVNSNAGRYVLQSGNKGRVKILPATSNVTSRSGALINLVDLRNQFNGNYVVLGKQILQVGQEAYPMDETHFFYLKFKYKNEDVAKKLSFDNNKLIIDAKEIFNIDGQSIEKFNTEMTMFYRNDETKKSYKINEFTPVFPDLTLLKKEVEELFSDSSLKSSSQKIDAVTSYLVDFYGTPQKDDLLAWLKKEFNIVKEEKINFK